MRQDVRAAQAEARAFTLVGELLHHSSNETTTPSSDALTLGSVVYKSIGHIIDQHEQQQPGYEPDFAAVTLQALHQLGFAHADYAFSMQIFEMLRIRIPDSKVLFPDTLPTLAVLKERGDLYPDGQTFWRSSPRARPRRASPSDCGSSA